MQAAGRDTTSTPLEFPRSEYERLLQTSLDPGTESVRSRAYDLGRAALDQRLGILEAVVLHHSLLDRRLRSAATADERSRLVAAAGELLVEFLSPFDMAYQGFLDANRALRGANDLLEGEARRIARLLHDSAGQLLFALQIAHTDLARDIPADLGDRFAEMGRLMQALDEQLHSTSDELYPVILQDLGLAAALQELLDTLGRRTRLETRFEGGLAERLRPDVESAMYRAAYEAIANAVRHARASTIVVSLDRTDGLLRCVVADDGVGIQRPTGTRARAGLGLVGIRDRLKSLKGAAEVRSAPGEGTQVVLELPLEEG